VYFSKVVIQRKADRNKSKLKNDLSVVWDLMVITFERSLKISMYYSKRSTFEIADDISIYCSMAKSIKTVAYGACQNVERIKVG
jgi:hypothetical protein